MFEKDADSQTAFGLISKGPIRETKAPSAPVDAHAQLHQVEASISRIERLPQSFTRIAYLFYSGSFGDAHKLLRHCLETLSQVFATWPLDCATPEGPLAAYFAFTHTVQKRNECLKLIREVCRYREEKDEESMAHCIEDGLIMKLKSLHASLRNLANVIQENS